MAELIPTWSRAECLAAAGALEGAVHMVDDDEDAQTLAKLADQWRTQAAETTGPATTPPLPGQDPSREHLIDLCERGVVPESRWSNRDTSSAQRQLGECLALLRAGCDFRLVTDTYRNDGRTHWVRIDFPGFGEFEEGSGKDDESFYVPTAQRLAQVAGGDWYC